MIASEVEEEELEEEEIQFLMLSKRLHITLSKPILKDEKTIRTYFKEGPYDSLHLTFKEENVNIPTCRVCTATASVTCQNIKEFIFEGPFIAKALLMIWSHCPMIETLSLTSPNLSEILTELCNVDAGKLEKLKYVILNGENSLEWSTKLREYFPTITMIKTQEIDKFPDFQNNFSQ